MRVVKVVVYLALAFAASACTGVFLQPDHVNYFPEVRQKLLLETGFIPTADGQSLNYWILPAQINMSANPHPRGLVIQVHGNGQNLSSHIRSLEWLTAAGYTVAIFDYRGYGQSSGGRDLAGVFSDVGTALDFFTREKNPDHLPVYFYGQSLGGTLLLKAVSSQPSRWHPAALIIESSFDSYTAIAREKLKNFWITWPFQWLADLLISDQFSLKAEELRSISPVPVYMFYSEDDPIVPLHYGQTIFAELAEPKKLFTYPERGHIAAMWVQKGRFRDLLIEALSGLK